MNRYKIVILVILFLVGSLIYVVLNLNDNVENYEKILINEISGIINDGIIIDVRTAEEYNIGHIENSINISVDEIKEIKNIVKEKDKQIFVYCRSGVRSLQAAEILIDLGYTNVYDAGGISNQEVNLVK